MYIYLFLINSSIIFFLTSHVYFSVFYSRLNNPTKNSYMSHILVCLMFKALFLIVLYCCTAQYITNILSPLTFDFLTKHITGHRLNINTG